MRVALLYEHPTWSIELIARMRGRGVDVTPVDLSELDGSLPRRGEMFDLWVNRVNTTIAVGCAADLRFAANEIGFPLLSKPNIGGSGAGITRNDSAAELEAAIEAGQVDLGIDGTGVAQRVIDSADGLVHRIEMLCGELLYATRQPIQAGAFNFYDFNPYANFITGYDDELGFSPIDRYIDALLASC